MVIKAIMIITASMIITAIRAITAIWERNEKKKSQKDRVFTTSKTILTLVSWHKTIAVAELWLSSGFDNDEI